uniref:Uncharacterized protein n=1 Tax=Rhizophora mucronata TaxID=61149 RepID=A0A2P2NMH5_RHIMU
MWGGAYCCSNYCRNRSL